MSVIKPNIVYDVNKKSCIVYQDVIDFIMSDIQGVAEQLPLDNLNYPWYRKCILHGSIEPAELYKTVYTKKDLSRLFEVKNFKNHLGNLNKC